MELTDQAITIEYIKTITREILRQYKQSTNQKALSIRYHYSNDTIGDYKDDTLAKIKLTKTRHITINFGNLPHIWIWRLDQQEMKVKNPWSSKDNKIQCTFLCYSDKSKFPIGAATFDIRNPHFFKQTVKFLCKTK